MRRNNYQIGFEGTTTNNESLKITAIEDRYTVKGDIKIKCGIYYICDIDGKECKLTADKIAVKLGNKELKRSSDFTPSNLEAIERGFINFKEEMANLREMYTTKVNTLCERYKVKSAPFEIDFVGHKCDDIHDDFVHTWKDVVEANKARAKEAKEAKESEKKLNKAIDILSGLSPEQIATIMAAMQAAQAEQSQE